MSEHGGSQAWEHAMLKAFEVLQPLSKPKLGPPVFGTPASGLIPCGRCRRMMPVEKIRYYTTGVCVASDSLCEECARLVPQHALVVCVGCQAVVARMAPERLKSGFVIEPRKIYHTDSCPKCKPGVEKSSIIEAELFYLKK
jgi:hypothetical protein